MSSGNGVLSSLILLQRAGAGKSPVLLLSPLEELGGGDSDEELDSSDEELDGSDEELDSSDEELVDERPALGSDELLDEELVLSSPLEELSGGGSDELLGGSELLEEELGGSGLLEELGGSGLLEELGGSGLLELLGG
jgi:hypothetical protein